MTNNKLDSMALAEIAIIRKGDAKVKKTRADGSEYESVGPDLKDRFRVAFFPGTEEYQKLFEKKYGTLKPTRIRAMMMSRSVYDSWSWANEGYTAGRMIAKADDTHFFTYRNPLTGVYEVKNGEPYREFTPGMVITYSRDGKPYSIAIRTVGRLRLFLPEMQHMVQFTMKTTSYYDRLNIDRQLNTIQMLADTLNNGNAAGIPIDVFRMEQDITWNKPDGSASRVKKWLVNIEPDPEWVKAATTRLHKFALTGETVAGMLMPQSEISGPVEPEDVDENPEDAEKTAIDVQAKDAPIEAPTPLEIETMTYEIAAAVIVERIKTNLDKTTEKEEIRMDRLTKAQLEHVVLNNKDPRKSKAAAVCLEHDYNMTQPAGSVIASQNAAGEPKKE